MDNLGKRVLVTGGAGFIGSHLVGGLIESGCRVSVMDNFLTGKRENIQGHTGELENLFEADIRDKSKCYEATKGIDAILHQAALPSVPRSIEDPALTNEINVTGTLNLLVAARDNGVKKFIFASSSSVYGDTPVLPKREDMQTFPLSPYALHKLFCEHYLRLFYELYNLETLSLRYFNIFGPRQDPKSQYAAVVPLFIKAMESSEPVTVFGDGEQTRDFTYVENVVRANLLAIKSSSLQGEAVNIGCGDQFTVNHLLDSLEKISEKSIARSYVETRPGDVLHSKADISKAKSLIGYEPTVSFEAGLRAMME
jgi:UDP-glucose 4-epimerase